MPTVLLHLLRFTEMGDTFPIPTCQSGWYSHQRGDQDGNQTRPQGPGAKAAAWRALAQARIYASRGGTHVRGVTPSGQRVGAGIGGRRQSGTAQQAAWTAPIIGDGPTCRAGTAAQGRRARARFCHRAVDAEASGRVDRTALWCAIQPYTGVATARQTGVQRTATEQQGAGARRSGHCRLEEEALADFKKTPQKTAA